MQGMLVYQAYAEFHHYLINIFIHYTSFLVTYAYVLLQPLLGMLYNVTYYYLLA